MKNKKSTPKEIKKVVTTTTTTTTTVVSETAPTETHYLLILDESGSMGMLRQQTLNGINEQIQTIKNLEKKYPEQSYFISIVKFENETHELLIDVPVSKVKELTMEDYNPNGGTALRDAIGSSVLKMKNRIQSRIDSGVATALVVILTDGEENASKEYTHLTIKKMIDELNETKFWTFSFIGANQDSVTTAGSYGIYASNTANFAGSGYGTRTAFAAVSGGIATRASGMYSFVGGGLSNTSFMSNVTGGKTDLGEDASAYKAIVDNGKTVTATGTDSITPENKSEEHKDDSKV